MKRLLCSSLLLSAVCALSPAAFAQSTYQLTLIEGDPATPNRTRAVDLNDRGEVAGVISVGGQNRSFLWRDGLNTEIGDLDGPTSPQSVVASAINDRGDVIGQTSSTGSPRPFIYSGGQTRELQGFTSALGVRPKDINNRRQVIGTVILPTSNPAVSQGVEFQQQGSSWSPLDPLPGDQLAVVSSINERGIVAGSSVGETGRATIWVEGRPVGLRDLPDAIRSEARDINDFNDIIGGDVTASELQRALVWRRGKVTELAGVGDPANPHFNRAESINNRRQIVGTQFEGDLQREPTRNFAVLWESDGKAFDLNELISSDDPLKPFVTLTVGQRINDRGQIIARGRDSRSGAASYLLTPIP